MKKQYMLLYWLYISSERTFYPMHLWPEITQSTQSLHITHLTTISLINLETDLMELNWEVSFLWFVLSDFGYKI